MADLSQSTGGPSDAELAGAAARGEAGAFDELYRRHVTAAWRVAMSVTGNREDAADVVAEAFTRVLAALPTGFLASGAPFRPYLLTATRNAAIDVLRRGGRTLPVSSVEERPSASADGAPAARLDATAEASLVAAAFSSLPERWRAVLWLTEVEGMPPRQAAEQLGLSPNGVAQLAVRARAGLRERYLQAHLKSATGDHAFTTAHLAAYVGGALSARDLATVDQHLAGCADCRSRLAELQEVGSTMRRVLLPLPIGLAALATHRWELLGAAASTAGGAVAATTAATSTTVAATGAATTATAAGAGGFAAALATPFAVKALAVACAVLLGLGAWGASVVDPKDAIERALGPTGTVDGTAKPGRNVIVNPVAVEPVAPAVPRTIRPRVSHTPTVTASAPAPAPVVTPDAPAPAPAPDPPLTEAPRPAPEPLVQVNVEVATGGGQGSVLGVGLGDGSCVGDCGEPGDSPGIGAQLTGSLLPPISLRLPPG
jgi:RNA polymerase sigma factor (sigma-70 family)